MNLILTDFEEIEKFPNHTYLDNWFKFWRCVKNNTPCEFDQMPEKIVIFWSAKWCKHCPRWKINFIQRMNDYHIHIDYPIFRADADEDEFTFGFLGGKAVPCIMRLTKGKIDYTWRTTDGDKDSVWDKVFM